MRPLVIFEAVYPMLDGREQRMRRSQWMADVMAVLEERGVDHGFVKIKAPRQRRDAPRTFRFTAAWDRVTTEDLIDFGLWIEALTDAG